MFFIAKASAQLNVTENAIARKLAEYLVGSGVIISNATLTNPSSSIIATGFFNNLGGTNINIDSGIVLTNGRAKSDSRNNKYGVDGNGVTPATSVRAENILVPVTTFSGDIDLANELGTRADSLHDAVILEFDFIALGDSIRFNYVLGSEEYTIGTVCIFNDAFGFFISGPGITGKKNLALIPNSNIPVSIKKVNNILTAGCINNPAYYVNNNSNTFFTYEGHTTVFTAATAVQPCQTYHLKLVIADAGDATWDSGVFLEAKSLTSNTLKINSLTQTDNNGNNYLVEGCATGAFTVKRPRVSSSPLAVNLVYGGTAVNGIDVQSLPSLVTIPANDSMVTINLVPIVDNLPEGIEELIVYASAGCNSGVPADSATIQIRDYDTLKIIPKQAGLCRGSSVQLIASLGYTSYTWDANPTLSNTLIRNPIATPIADSTIYICSAVQGNCHAKDSALIAWKTIGLKNAEHVLCHNDSIGIINVEGGWEWARPVLYSINGTSYQTDSTFINLPVGAYTIKIKDVLNCVDSVTVNIIQLFPDLAAAINVQQASCSGNADGVIKVHPSGGSSPYLFSSDAGISYQADSSFYVLAGNYPIVLKDINGCKLSQNINVVLNDTVTLIKSADTTICEGRSHRFSIISNTANFEWTPVVSLSNALIANPVATPVITTKYFIKAFSGICIRKDSITVFVNPAPLADAGADTSVCTGGTVQLNGSGGIIYQWYPATFLNNPSLSRPFTKPLGTFNYYLNVIDANGCRSLHPDTVKVKVVPLVKMFAGNDTVVAINQPLQLNGYEINNSGVTSFSWSPTYGLNDPFIASPVAILDRDITYTLTGLTPLGCIGSDNIRIKVYKGPELYVPNAFTPNSDGLNDVLKVITAGIKSFNYFRVYDRWGQVVFSTSNAANGWDGSIKGRAAATGSYVWMAEAIDYTGKKLQRKGTVTIIK